MRSVGGGAASVRHVQHLHPALCARSSLKRCAGLPTPGVPSDSSPGRAFAVASRSASVRWGALAGTTMTEWLVGQHRHRRQILQRVVGGLAGPLPHPARGSSCPSAACAHRAPASATWSAPSVPAAPGTFSAVAPTPQARPRPSASMRPPVSTRPPGRQGTTMRIGRLGKTGCACTAPTCHPPSPADPEQGTRGRATPHCARQLLWHQGLLESCRLTLRHESRCWRPRFRAC
jgi:hypothetical protein